ncbi:M3 family metallopeptidase [Chitinophaga flava]|nr:M3 family metallopeptidase [Chitinophaga flava]
MRKGAYASFLCFFVAIVTPAAAQQKESFTDFHVDFTRFFPSLSEEQASRQRLMDSVKTFQTDTVWNRNNLIARLDRSEQLQVSLQRHYLYRKLAAWGNIKDSAAKADMNQLSSSIGVLETFVNNALQRPAVIAAAASVQDQTALKKYDYRLRQAREKAVHTPAVRDQELIDKLVDPVLDGLIDRYDRLMDKVKGEPVITPSGDTLEPVSKRSVLLKHPDAAVRAAGARAYSRAYAQHGELLAATLIDIVRHGNNLAGVYNYVNAPQKAYAGRLQLTDTSVKALLDEMMKHAAVVKDYQRLQAAQLMKQKGLTSVHSWDLSLPTGWNPPAQSFASTRRTILKALSPLGKEYVSHYSWLLDPQQGALDLSGGPNRQTEFTSLGYPGVPVSVYMKEYDGSLKAALVLIHEGGHAIHRKLMGEGVTVPSYSRGPNFLFESFAMLNQLLLLDELIQQAATREEKIFYTKRLTDYLAFELFTSAVEGTFEEQLYEGVAAGKINNQQDIDSLYTGIASAYSIYTANEPESSTEWINKRLLFDDPLYNVNYLYAVLVACKLLDMSHQDARFAEKYVAMLRHGFDAPANELLQHYMGFSLDHGHLLNGALRLMQDKTQALRGYYDQQ